MTWGPSVTYLRLYDHAGVLQDEQLLGTASFSFRNNILLTGMINRDLERFQQVDFRKTGYGFFGVISARVVSLYGGYNWGDGVLYDEVNPYVGRSKMGNINVRLQATSRLRGELTTILSDFVNPLDNTEVFDVKIFRSRTTYQFTDRLSLRHIMEHNTQNGTLGNNILMTYRINAGTVVFLGYDDRFQRGQPDRGRDVADHGPATDQPGLLWQALLPVPILTLLPVTAAERRLVPQEESGEPPGTRTLNPQIKRARRVRPLCEPLKHNRELTH